MRRYPGASVANGWTFTLIGDGTGDVVFALNAGAGCENGGICTSAGTTLTGVPEPIEVHGPEEDGEQTVLTGFTLVHTETGATATLDDGAEVELPDPANTIVGVRVETGAGAEIGSVRLTLAGAKAQARTENLAPYSLYGDDGTSPHGEGLPVGSYTLTATAYSQGNLGGAVLQTLSVSFTVAAAGGTTVEEPEANALTAAFQDVPAGHNGPDRAFVFKVLFSEPIPTSYTVLRDQAFEVSAGGAVTKAKRVDGRDDLREIHVDTSTWDNVTVTRLSVRTTETPA